MHALPARASSSCRRAIELTGNQQLFAKLGFVETARTAHQGYDRPTSITMRKALA